MYIACDGSLACTPLPLTSSINIAFSSTLPRVAIDNNIPISYISCNLTDAGFMNITISDYDGLQSLEDWYSAMYKQTLSNHPSSLYSYRFLK